jgi:hypothetical protein
LPIIVLFQHPSPSPEKSSRNAIATASKDCMHALVSCYIEKIHYVFDYNPSKNTWSGDKLQALSLSLNLSVNNRSLRIHVHLTPPPFQKTVMKLCVVPFLELLIEEDGH